MRRKHLLLLCSACAILLAGVLVAWFAVSGYICTLYVTNDSAKPFGKTTVKLATRRKALGRIAPGETVRMPVSKSDYSAILVKGTVDGNRKVLAETGFQLDPGFALRAIDIEINGVGSTPRMSTSYKNAWTFRYLKLRTRRWWNTGEW